MSNTYSLNKRQYISNTIIVIKIIDGNSSAVAGIKSKDNRDISDRSSM